MIICEVNKSENYKALYLYLLPSEAVHQRVLYCDIFDITNHSTDIYLLVLGR